MGMFEGKKGLILGVANERSIAWAIAKQVMDEGGRCGFSHLPDRPDDDKNRNRRRVERCLKGYEESAPILVPLDVRSDEQIQQVVDAVVAELGQLDFVLHSIAFADRDDLNRDTVETSRDGFKMAMEISAYSLIAVSNAVRPHMAPQGSILTMTYCKAALEASVRYLAYDLGPEGTRVNAISAGPLKTLAGSAAGVGEMLKMYKDIAPMARNVTHEEVGRSGAFLLSSCSDGITGEVLHVDAGYNMMGSPGRLLDKMSDSEK